ncbi:putative Zn(2)-C6 fungal-type domain-containing protein [Seiridium cardinale]|uniref:Zn(2)-C6 fungal-type domain-containing protein n=1 Tax=Seiridium cardinale TaxID=138064 RepID=A0ABR2Y7T6_9PEZI
MATFTALNGNEPQATESLNRSPASKPVETEERGATAGQEQRTSGEVSSSQREHWSGGNGERAAYQAADYASYDGIHKRKRSTSSEPRREAAGLPDERSASHHHPESRDVYGSHHRERDRRSYGDEGREDSWYSQSQSQSQSQRDGRTAYDQQHSSGSILQNEEQSGDGLRGGPGTADSQDYSPTSPDDGDDSAYYGGSYTSDHRRDGAVQSDPKKRKRNFSNRTKTGCLTCRKRKKKCDELKPECNNCLRGGFLCQGYPNQRGYQKMESKPTAVPLESKDPSYVPPGAYGMPQAQSPYVNHLQPPSKREPPPPFRGPSLRIDPPQGRTIHSEDEQTASTIPTASVFSPDNKPSAVSAYTTPANVFPTPISAISSANTNFGEHRGMQKEYQRIPPLHDTSRTEPETPHPGSALPQINIFQPTRTSSPARQPQPPASNAQVAAQLALNHNHFAAAKRPPTQKELMLRGESYKPFDKELVLERERCSATCWRFNNATNPNNGVSAAERARLFHEILTPSEPIHLFPTQTSPVNAQGRVGVECVVEAPFVCDYGYNISIGDNVFIGRNCTVLDACSVTIGKNVYIGPNVSIFTATLSTDPGKRGGSKSSQVGRKIMIEDDAWIGGGAIILPGRRIGKGSTVAAGSVVTKDVPNFVITAGNPSQIIRGVTTGSL